MRCRATKDPQLLWESNPRSCRLPVSPVPWNRYLPKPIHLVLVVTFALCGTTRSLDAQTLDVRDAIVTVAQGLGVIDDVCVLPNGDLIVAQPTLQALSRISPATGIAVPMPLPPIISPAIDVDAQGMIYACDGAGASGAIRRIDPVTFAVTTISLGFTAPFDITVAGPTTAYVADLTSSNFQSGNSEIWRIDWSNGLPAQKTLVATGFLGPADVAVAANGTIWVTSYAEPSLKSIDPLTGTVTTVPLSEPIYGATDCAFTANGGLVITLTAFSRLVYVEPAAGVVVTIADTIGGSPVGLEDLAVDPHGDVLVTQSSGEVYRVDTSSPFRCIGNPHIGSTVLFVLDAVAPPGRAYAIGCSLTVDTGLDAGGQVIPLDPDDLLLNTLSPRPEPFINFDGILDGTGSALAAVNLPPDPYLIGVTVYFAAAAFDPQQILPLSGITNAVRMTIEP